jgi:peroxiredoxin Q/BCP
VTRANPPAADLDFECANAGLGPDPLSVSDLADDFAVLYFQRDQYCTNCRDQVRAVADRYREFRERNAEVVSILPEPVERAREWVEEYDLPYPLLADPGAEVGEAYGQPVRFGPLGRFSDFFGRMPEVVILDLRGDPEVGWVHRGSSTFDRPSVDAVLDELDRLRAG